VAQVVARPARRATGRNSAAPVLGSSEEVEVAGMEELELEEVEAELELEVEAEAELELVEDLSLATGAALEELASLDEVASDLLVGDWDLESEEVSSEISPELVLEATFFWLVLFTAVTMTVMRRAMTMMAMTAVTMTTRFLLGCGSVLYCIMIPF